jgi:hypothetical protein
MYTSKNTILQPKCSQIFGLLNNKICEENLAIPIMFLEQRNQRTGFIYLVEKIILSEYGFHVCGGFIMLTNKRVPCRKKKKRV